MFMIPCSWEPNDFLPIFLFTGSLFLSSVIVAKWIWEPMRRKFDSETMPRLPYKDDYPIDENDAESDNLEEMINNIIIENTPDGTVFMRYNHEIEGFEYWSENSIDRKFLDTVARKYVLTFRCSNAYVERTTKIVKEEEKDVSNNDVDSHLFVQAKKSKGASKKLVACGNKFKYMGVSKEAPFFQKKEKSEAFFCGAEVEGLSFEAFKNAIFKKKFD